MGCIDMYACKERREGEREREMCCTYVCVCVCLCMCASEGHNGNYVQAFLRFARVKMCVCVSVHLCALHVGVNLGMCVT